MTKARTAFHSEPYAEILLGDCRDALRSMPGASVHAVVTSPPYYGLRDYGLPPSMWGGDEAHEHEWGEPLRSPRANEVSGPNGSNGKNSPQTKIFTKEAGTACPCGAWRGVLGLEPTPELYVSHLVKIFREVRRVLRPDGTLWLNLGDSYTGSGGAGGDYGTGGLRDGQPVYRSGLKVPYKGTRAASPKHAAGAVLDFEQPNRFALPGLKAKDLIGIPWMAAFALRADGWWLRQKVTWIKTSAMPESAEDRPTCATEEIFLLSRSGSTRFWTHRDLPGTRTAPAADYRWIDRETGEERATAPEGWTPDQNDEESDLDDEEPVDLRKRWRRRNLWRAHDYFFDVVAGSEIALRPEEQRWDDGTGGRAAGVSNEGRGSGRKFGPDPALRRPRNWWMIGPEGGPAGHYAKYPTEIPRRAILMATSERGCCASCGAPWTRVLGGAEPTGGRGSGNLERKLATAGEQGRTNSHMGYAFPWQPTARRTVDWRPTCDHAGEPVPCVVLDPFLGSGTTVAVAKSLGRRGVGVELSRKYAEIARRRISNVPIPMNLWGGNA